MAKKTKLTIEYADAIKELEQILERLRNGEVAINELAPTVKRANDLVEECRRQLTHTQIELEKITEVPF
ncbi:MAG: exodeoxyribonuclease VII small subunit [Alistipes sp.]|nr:exodeoxyribonuclease VII small subunit [Alistipes sp.]